MGDDDGSGVVIVDPVNPVGTNPASPHHGTRSSSDDSDGCCLFFLALCAATVTSTPLERRFHCQSWPLAGFCVYCALMIPEPWRDTGGPDRIAPARMVVKVLAQTGRVLSVS